MTTQLISHYRILDKLGKGGMSEVYLAEDTKLDRKVAIKFLLPEFISNDRSRKRLIREAKAIASLDHPNICAIYEVDEDLDQTFIVMQYVEGQTLSAKAADRQITVQEAIGIAVQVAAALCEAHGRGIIHRDLKPQNIMVTARGLVKVLDFGLAKTIYNKHAVDADANTISLLSATGTILGTLPYLSPEQSRSEELDVRSDIFSFGTVLYELVSGRNPFVRGNPASTLLAISTDSPPPLARYAVDVAPELERIVRKCLEKNPERRYQSARELSVDLDHLQRTLYSDTSITDESYSSTHQRASWLKRSLNRYLLAAVFIAILVGVSLYFYNTRTRGPINSVAVLPFNHIADNGVIDGDTKVLMDWISESIANSLQELPLLQKVIAPYSIFALKKEGLSPQEVGQQYDVQAVLTGRFDQLGDQITVYINLIDARDNSLIRGRSYSFLKSEGNTVKERICSQITEDLRLKLTPEEQLRLTQRETNNADASIEYQKGRDYWSKRHVTDIRTSIGYFKRALEIDPLYAKAHAGLADAYAVLAESESPRENATLARLEAEKALRLDGKLAEANTSLAIIAFKFDWDWPTVEAKFKRSIELKPNSPDAHYWYAGYLSAMGRAEQSVNESQRAAELDPLNPTYRIQVARMLYWAGRLDEALTHCKRAVDMNDNSAVAHLVLGLIYRKKGMYDQAIAEFQHALTLTEDKSYLKSAIGATYAIEGKRDEAKAILQELAQLAKERYVSPMDFASVEIALGNKDQAFTSLERAFSERSNLLPFLKVDPIYDSLRSDPRFNDLLRRAGLLP